MKKISACNELTFCILLWILPDACHSTRYISRGHRLDFPFNLYDLLSLKTILILPNCVDPMKCSTLRLFISFFTVCQGIHQIEKVCHMQEMLFSLSLSCCLYELSPLNEPSMLHNCIYHVKFACHMQEWFLFLTKLYLSCLLR